MYWHATNYAKQDGRQPGQLAHRSFWLGDAPRLMLWCRLRGHRPVVDGYDPHRPGGDAARWVCCDRCGVRPEPQGSPDPEQYAVGDPYTGPYIPLIRVLVARSIASALGLKPTLNTDDQGRPGPWPDNPGGTVGAEVIVGKTFGVFSIAVEVGSAGEEHTLSAHLRINPLGAIYLHTERFGTWLQRRLIPKGYDSRSISLGLGDWRLRWQIWAVSNSWSRDTPRWQDGSLSLDLMEQLLGPKRYSYEDVGMPVLVPLHLAEGEAYQVRLRLKRVRFGRPKGRRPKMSWSVEWMADRGIPTKPTERDGEGVTSAAVTVPDESVAAGAWDVTARELITKWIEEQRARYGYRPGSSEADGDAIRP
ncbi:hypothetical protein [Streptosporangium sp. OZ121]|uniref:hypothetical protein n=1 Tax=Streptosporangium sp. OZ121 TaxID=3444183 RepID=UPI003F7AB0EF